MSQATLVLPHSVLVHSLFRLLALSLTPKLVENWIHRCLNWPGFVPQCIGTHSLVWLVLCGCKSFYSTCAGASLYFLPQIDRFWDSVASVCSGNSVICIRDENRIFGWRENKRNCVFFLSFWSEGKEKGRVLVADICTDFTCSNSNK